jgi:integrase
MASIHKDPRGKSPFWYCAFTLPNGKRTFKSTKLTDRDEALRFCLAMAGASDKATARNLPEEQARKILDQIRTLAGDDPIRFRSLETYSREWLISKKATTSAGTLARYAGIVREFVSHVGASRNKANIDTTTAREVKAFRDFQLREGKSPTTANLALKTLRAMFNDARREGLVTINPAEQVDTLRAEKESRDVFTHEQLRGLIAGTEGDWKTAILLAYYGGLRLTDAVGLSWENVNLERREIRFLPRKTSHGLPRRIDWKKHVTGQLEIPIMPEMEAHLLTLAGTDDPTAKLCPELASKGTGGNRGLSSMFNRIMAKVDIYSDAGAEKTGKGRRFKSLGFHSLRHTFVSELANADVPADVRQKISGHKDEDVHERYSHLDLDAKRRALGKMRPLSA